MVIILDENVSLALANVLRQAGYEVKPGYTVIP